VDNCADDVIASTLAAESLAACSPDNSGSAVDQGFWPVLKNGSFLTLWIGQVFSQIADKVYLVLIISVIDQQFQAPDQTISGWVSSVMVAFTIPAVLFGSLAGVFVDRWRKRTVLVSTNLMRGLLVLSLPLLLWFTQDFAPWFNLPVGFYLLLGVTFLVSTLTQFFAPAEQSVIPLLVPKQNLLSANSLYTTTMIGSVVLGFALGEPLLALADRLVDPLVPTWQIGEEAVVGGAYLLAGLILLAIRPVEQSRPEAPDQEEPHVWADIREGLRYLGQSPRIRAAMIQLAMLSSILAALSVLAVRLAEVLPNLETAQFGFLLAAGGVGMAIGAVIVGLLGQKLGSFIRISLYGAVGMGISLLGLATFMGSLWSILLLIACLGICAALVGVPMQTTIQAETPEALRGKVFGLQNNAVNITLSLPLALAGLAETFFGLRVVFFGLAAIAITGGWLTWYIADSPSTR